MRYVEIKVCFDNKEQAQHTRQILLDNHLVACGQIYDIDSTYWWQNNIEHTPEFMLVLKTVYKNYKPIEKVILANHSYQVPEIICTRMVKGYKPYLDWIDENISVRQ